MPLVKFAAALLLLGTWSIPLAAQHRQVAVIDRAVQLTVDNDLIALRGAGAPPDYDYTHGTMLTVAWAGAPRWLRPLANDAPACGAPDITEGRCLATAAHVGQAIYTPRRDAAEPLPGERPYAGWLHAGAVAHLVTERRTRTIGLMVGVTGRPSLAEAVQNRLHRWLGNAPQLGWPHQLEAQPGVLLHVGETWSRERALPIGHGRLTAAGGAVAGNVRTAVQVAVTGRLARRPGTLWSPLRPSGPSALGPFVVGGVQQELVFWDLFLDGDASGATASAVRRPWVGQAVAGAGWRWRRGAVEYRHVLRTPEYRAQPTAHAYGSLAVTLHGPPRER